MYAARAKITNLEAEVQGLKKSKADFKEGYEEARSHRECVEVELNAQILSKDRDLTGKDTEIAELKRRLREAHEGLDAEKQKVESLEIDLKAEKVKVETAEEARKISTSTLNVAQMNYVEAQSIVDTLLSDSEWMQHHGVAHVANSILNETELDKAVVGLTMDAHAAGHRAGYVECTQHVEETLKQHFDTHHCSASDQAKGILVKAEEVYDNLSLHEMDLVTEALKHDGYVSRLKSIFEVPDIVELTMKRRKRVATARSRLVIEECLFDS
ncbi:hypothetical protein HanPI659440_Chr11g0417651 [Helianthus annuus]|uniref:Uncharacterized protein n=1 Tax=Helianthus annuus TaxID=4232 RepID=A0A9K3MZM8_HELAN|nr:hypothetical protein HanXRQr2_Chr11g0485941 [Helianthus annuus]KAJ0734242.1 hypothetical protein HanPI659440_Chr11g0417651 [Helianthus annuus]